MPDLPYRSPEEIAAKITKTSSHVRDEAAVHLQHHPAPTPDRCTCSAHKRAPRLGPSLRRVTRTQACLARPPVDADEGAVDVGRRFAGEQDHLAEMPGGGPPNPVVPSGSRPGAPHPCRWSLTSASLWTPGANGSAPSRMPVRSPTRRPAPWSCGGHPLLRTERCRWRGPGSRRWRRQPMSTMLHGVRSLRWGKAAELTKEMPEGGVHVHDPVPPLGDHVPASAREVADVWLAQLTRYVDTQKRRPPCRPTNSRFPRG